ncbi:MAG: hypothetical protein CSB01_01390 [Bacteroidia bacterium]|nr:MAG: hypothetical protein CSB01_01390 [Bacteroidia bacterium]
MITANFTSATDNSGQTGRYPVSIEVLNLLQEQSVFISKTFGAMFGRNNLILKVPTETEDGLCLWEGELVPIDHRASSYIPEEGQDYSIVFQTSEIPNFDEDIEVAGEIFLQARQMTKAFIFTHYNYDTVADFERSEEGQRVGAFIEGKRSYGIITLEDDSSYTDLFPESFLDVTGFFNRLPQIYESFRGLADQQMSINSLFEKISEETKARELLKKEMESQIDQIVEDCGQQERKTDSVIYRLVQILNDRGMTIPWPIQ